MTIDNEHGRPTPDADGEGELLDDERRYDDEDDEDDDAQPRMADRARLDKWLWAARFFKARGLAAQACEAGKVKLNGERVKAARDLKVGDTLHITIGDYEWEVTVRGLGLERGPAPMARDLYEETEESQDRRALLIANRKAFPEPSYNNQKGRVPKRDRRDRPAAGSVHGGFAGPMDHGNLYSSDAPPPGLPRDGGGGRNRQGKRRGGAGQQNPQQRGGQQRPGGQRPPQQQRGPQQGGQGAQGGGERRADGAPGGPPAGPQGQGNPQGQPGGGGKRRGRRRGGKGRGQGQGPRDPNAIASGAPASASGGDGGGGGGAPAQGSHGDSSGQA